MGLQTDNLTQGKTSHDVAYIDFSFADKKLSDFGWVAVSDGDRLSAAHSSSFEDEVTQVPGAKGQYFWGTRFTELTRTFQLATDGVTEQDWNAFKLHFVPGKYGKFIEDSLSDRNSYCRVSSVSEMKFIPFKEIRTIKGRQIEVSVYKGECSLTFTWDNPETYATKNYYNSAQLTDQDCRNAFYNGAPFSDSWQVEGYKCIIGDAKYSLNKGALHNDITISSENQEAYGFYYNPSNTETKAVAVLTLPHQVSHTGTPTATNPIYLTGITDRFSNAAQNYDYIRQYQSIPAAKDKIENPNEYKTIGELRYTSPDIMQQINYAIWVAANFYQSVDKLMWSPLDLADLIRYEITNATVRKWAIKVIQKLQGIAGFTSGMIFNSNTQELTVGLFPDDKDDETKTSYTVDWFGFFNLYMIGLLASGTGDISNWKLLTNSFVITFDGPNSTTWIKYGHRSLTNTTEFVEAEEKCGEMLLSGYLTLDGGDTLNEEGNIQTCHPITVLRHNVENNIMPGSLTIEYKYTYI